MERGFQAKTSKHHVVKKNSSRHGASRPLSENLFPCNPGQKNLRQPRAAGAAHAFLSMHASVVQLAWPWLSLFFWPGYYYCRTQANLSPFHWFLGLKNQSCETLWKWTVFLISFFFFCIQCVRWYHREEHYAACPRDEATQVSLSLLLFLSVQLWNT